MKMKFIIVLVLICYTQVDAEDTVTTSGDGSGEPEVLFIPTNILELSVPEDSGSDDESSGSGSLIQTHTAALQPVLTTLEASGDESSGDGELEGGFIYSSTETPQEQGPRPVIESYHVISKVTARYVSTSVLATVNNTANVAQEVPFSFKISEEAFISSYIMIIDGVPYEAEVREKVAAQKAYNQARNQGRDASQVKQKDEDPTRFLVDLNLAAESTVVFNLTYQEVLRRDKGQFRHQIDIAPGQVVDDFQVEVNILEPQGITFIDSRWTPDDEIVQPIVSFHPPSSQANVLFRPSRSFQSRSSPELGVAGVLEVTYDVQHDFNGGDIQIANGYFVHYISPEGLPPAPKKVVFVLDISSSMGYLKFKQMKDVMIEILGQLREIDQFNVLPFEGWVHYWQEAMVPATPENIESARSYVRTMSLGNDNDFYLALRTASQQFTGTDEAFPAIFFLTDGIDWTSTAELLSTAVREHTEERIAVFTIGFGADVDGPLLEQLAGKNHGLYRQIMVDANAQAEMRGFFEEFATPLLFNINVQYEDDAVDTTSLTKEDFIGYFDGKELLVAGKLSEEYNGNHLKAVVTAKGNEQLLLKTTKEIGQVDPNMIEDFAQRSWAYMKIKDLLAREKITWSTGENEALREKALDLSLRYSFVTPLTSLIVVKPAEGDDSSTEGTDLLQEQAYGPPAQPPPQRPQRPSWYGYGGYAGGDPHIIIQDKSSDVKFCFDIHGPNGTVVNLLDDPNLGVTVNAEMVESVTSQTSNNPDKTKLTYFHHIAIRVADDWIVASRDDITVKGEGRLEWPSIADTKVGSCTLTLRNGTTATIDCANGVVMTVTRRTNRENLEHLDFQLGRGGPFSSSVNGIVGQFQRRQLTLIEPTKRLHSKRREEKAKLLLDGEESITVHKIVRIRGTCWNSYTHRGLPMLEMSYLTYIVKGLFDQPDYELI